LKRSIFSGIVSFKLDIGRVVVERFIHRRSIERGHSGRLCW
jgi:hypothetical protein